MYLQIWAVKFKISGNLHQIISTKRIILDNIHVIFRHLATRFSFSLDRVDQRRGKSIQWSPSLPNIA